MKPSNPFDLISLLNFEWDRDRLHDKELYWGLDRGMEAFVVTGSKSDVFFSHPKIVSGELLPLV
jgi:hypothetical protein